MKNKLMMKSAIKRIYDDSINFRTVQFGTQVPKCLEFERLLNAGPQRQDVLHVPVQPWQNFPLCSRRPS